MTRCFSASGTPPMYSAHRPRDGTAARRMNSHMIDYTYTATRTSGDATSQRQTWRPLELLNIYRLISSALLTFVALVHVQFIPLGEQNPALFIVVSIGYLMAALLFVITLHARAPGIHVQLYAQALVDIVCIILLTNSSGGIRSGLGTLLIVTLAGGGMLRSGRRAVRYAAISTLAILGEERYLWISSAARDASFTHAGLLGATFFLTALLAYGLARRARESEALAAQRGVALANMQQLTEYVIQRMQTGVIVIDQNQRIRLITESAWHLLGFPVNPTREMLATLGRRSASIAHEIRIPLGAISHAGQLLAESPQLAECDVRLTEIFREHS